LPLYSLILINPAFCHNRVECQVYTCKTSPVDGQQSVTELIDHIRRGRGGRQLTVQPDE